MRDTLVRAFTVTAMMDETWLALNPQHEHRGFPHPLRRVGAWLRRVDSVRGRYDDAIAQDTYASVRHLLACLTVHSWAPITGHDELANSIRQRIHDNVHAMSGGRYALMALDPGHSVGETIRRLIRPTLEPLRVDRQQMLAAALTSAVPIDQFSITGLTAVVVPAPLGVRTDPNSLVRFRRHDSDMVRATAETVAQCGIPVREAIPAARMITQLPSDVQEITAVLLHDGMDLETAVASALALA